MAIDFIIHPGYAVTFVCYDTARTSPDVEGSRVDLTGYSFAATIKEAVDEETEVASTAPALASFTFAITTPQTGSNTGRFTMSLTSEQTTTIGTAIGPTGIAKFDVVRKEPGGSQGLHFSGVVRCRYLTTDPIE